MIGSIRRECLGNVVVLSERHLRRILKDYLSHYHRWCCHQSLEMDCLEPRPVQAPEVGEVVAVREAGGLYWHYERVAALGAKTCHPSLAFGAQSRDGEDRTTDIEFVDSGVG